MPTPNQYVTTANSINPLYITRAEVIQGFSTLAGDLSGVNLSSFFINPNPLFSTVGVNSAGLISGFAPIQTSNVILNSNTNVGAAGNLRLGNLGNLVNRALCATDNNGNMAPMRANSYAATIGTASGFGAGFTFNNSGFGVFDPQFSTTQVIGWQLGSANTINLTNISSINGAPVNANPTTYTNLTGNNITNSQVIGTPSLVNVSSINGLPLTNYANQQPWVPYTVTNTGTQNITLTSGVASQCLAFTNLPITAALNKAVNISVPIVVTPTGTLASPVNVSITGLIGGGVTGGSGVSAAPISFAAGQGTGNGRTITLSGTCIVNGNQASLVITAVADQNVTLSFTQGSSVFAKFFFQQIV